MNAIDAITSANLPSSAPRLREARFEDYAEIRRLASENSIALPSIQDWQQRWTENPVWHRVGNGRPIGWVLETETNEIVGSMETIPTLYKFRGSELLSAASSLWCVSARYRGFALALIDEYFNQDVDLFISTTVSASAFKTLSQLYDQIPAGRWDTVSCCVGHFPSFAEQSLQKLHVPFSSAAALPVSVALRVASAIRTKPLAALPRDVTIETVTAFDSRFDEFWSSLVRLNPEKLLAERSRRVLNWHYAASMRAGRLWVLTAVRQQRLVAYCTFQEAPPSNALKRVRLVDFQSIDDRDLLPAFIRVALERCVAERFYVLDHVGAGVPRMKAFDEHALYEKPLGTWMFFFRAANAQLDAELHQPQFWDPSLFEGDATFY